MMNSVNSGNGVSHTDQAQASSETSSVSETPEVSQGYSGAVTTSSTEEEPPTTTISAELPEPEPVNVTAESFVSKSLDAHIDARLSAVRNQQKINSEDVYLNDTDSLLLMMKSFVNELTALASLQSIDQAFGNRLQAQSVRQDKAKSALVVKARIQERQDNIQEKNQRISEYSGTLAEKHLSKNLKEHIIANAEQEQASGIDRSGDLAQYNVQLLLLEHEIANIETEVAGLQSDVTELQGLNVVDEEVVSAYKRALDVVQEELVNVGSLVGRVKQRFDGEALQTGEDNVEAIKEAGKEVTLDARREEMRLKAQSDRSRDLDKDLRRSDIQRTDDVQENRLFESQLSFLPPKEAAVLQEVFGRVDLKQLQAALKDLPKEALEKAAQLRESQSGEQQSGIQKAPPLSADEAFSIVLQSALKEVPESSEEERTNPAASTYRGDNLSFEGAKNPRIFAELWLQAMLDQGDDTQAAKEEHLEDGQEAVAEVEQVQQQGFADALQSFATIPEETAESLDEGKQAKAYISRNSPV